MIAAHSGWQRTRVWREAGLDCPFSILRSPFPLITCAPSTHFPPCLSLQMAHIIGARCHHTHYLPPCPRKKKNSETQNRSRRRALPFEPTPLRRLLTNAVFFLSHSLARSFLLLLPPRFPSSTHTRGVIFCAIVKRFLLLPFFISVSRSPPFLLLCSLHKP